MTTTCCLERKLARPWIVHSSEVELKNSVILCCDFTSYVYLILVSHTLVEDGFCLRRGEM